MMRGLEIGVNDYLMRPVERSELLARVRTQLRRKRYSDRLRHSLQLSLEMAITDQLTGLHNRRYMARHLDTLMRNAGPAKPISFLIMDIDFGARTVGGGTSQLTVSGVATDPGGSMIPLQFIPSSVVVR